MVRRRIGRKKLSRRDCVVVLAGGLATAMLGRSVARAARLDITYPGGLIFHDIDRFRAAYAKTKRGKSAISAMEWYIEGATEGLNAYLQAYDVTAIDLAARLSSHPKFYAELADIRDRVAHYENDIVQAAQNLRLLVPELPKAPMYFFVGAMGHGATVKEVTPAGGEHGLGVLVPIELVAVSPQTETAEFGEDRQRRASLDALPQLTTHELAHVAQVQHQGLERYRVIYRERSRGNHLAFAIREGGADFLSHLASGRLRERHHHLSGREAELWQEFSQLLYEPVDASRGWFSGRSEEHPDRPGQPGYAIGWSICKCFHEHASDKAVALREILSANEVADFERIVAPYRHRFGVK